MQNAQEEEKEGLQDLENALNLENGIFDSYMEKAKEKLQTLSLEEKIGQMLLVTYGVNDNTNPYGGILFFANHFENKTAEEVKTMIGELRSSSNIPFLTAVDEEGKTEARDEDGNIIYVDGNIKYNGVNRISMNSSITSAFPDTQNYLSKYGFTQFPNSQTLYAKGGFTLVREDTIEKSKFLYSLGLNLDLAPVADICNPGDYMYHRSVGLDAEGTARYIKTVVNASKEAKKNGYEVSYCLKHFPGYGNNADTHVGASTDTRTKEDVKRDMLSFEAGIQAGVESVLISHNVVSSVDDNNPASLSPAINSLLREEAGFTGVIITDALNMGAVDSIPEKYAKAVLAGNDILIVTRGNEAAEEIKAAIISGTITEERINESATRILAWKYAKGLMK